MLLYPAIDLRDGQVVRLSQGDYDRQTTYSNEPAAVARGFVEAGAKWIHVVDLDAARSGTLTNTEAVQSIVAEAHACGAKVQNGGGVRSVERMEHLWSLGVDRVVIGSAAVKKWDWFLGVLAQGEVDNSRIALGLDARDGRVAAEGWEEQLDLLASDLASAVSGSGLGAIVYTDIARDGMLTGVNLDATSGIIAATDVPVIASGGIGSAADITACGAIGCDGTILGRAYYEGKVRIDEALAACI
jgi:phosphoribosylformimino-5-aminoimidazole carboxamide ribotide isomerase